MVPEASGNRRPIAAPSSEQVGRAIRFSYAQVMLGAIFAASTGGMFLVGFAMRLGAGDIALGLISTVPAYLVVFQFAASYLVERGWSRKRMSIAFAMLTGAGWTLIAAIPLLGGSLGVSGRLGLLIGVISVVTVSANLGNNARASWVGELIPEERRGRFFGYCMTFAGLIASGFAIVEGLFLDEVSHSSSLMAFAGLFLFGSAFGLATAALHIPQPDCPLPPLAGRSVSFQTWLREAVRNRPLRQLALVHATLALGGIAGPFNAAYCLRDVGIGFFGLGLLNAAATAAMLVSSPLWGRLADRFGCRPVLVLGLVVLIPLSAVWLLIPPGAPGRAYWLLPWTNFAAGLASAAVSVSISTMLYKLAPARGRSVQLAAYSVFVTVVGAPMPLLGGYLVTALREAGWAVDLRLTFYLWSLFMLLAAVQAWRLREAGSLLTRSLVLRYFPARIDNMFRLAISATGSLVGWLRGPARRARRTDPGAHAFDEDEPKGV